MRKSLNLVVIMGAFALASCGSGDPAPQTDMAKHDQAAEPAAEVVSTNAEAAPDSTQATPVATTATAPAAPAIFAQCKACHNIAPGKNGIGPSLAGVFGATAGHVGDYTYSSAMKSSGHTWDAAALDAYLKSPRETVPGTKMSYAGLRDDAKRAELIEYLKTL